MHWVGNVTTSGLRWTRITQVRKRMITQVMDTWPWLAAILGRKCHFRRKNKKKWLLGWIPGFYWIHSIYESRLFSEMAIQMMAIHVKNSKKSYIGWIRENRHLHPSYHFRDFSDFPYHFQIILDNDGHFEILNISFSPDDLIYKNFWTFFPKLTTNRYFTVKINKLIFNSRKIHIS